MRCLYLMQMLGLFRTTDSLVNFAHMVAVADEKGFANPPVRDPDFFVSVYEKLLSAVFSVEGGLRYGELVHTRPGGKKLLMLRTGAGGRDEKEPGTKPSFLAPPATRVSPLYSYRDWIETVRSKRVSAVASSLQALAAILFAPGWLPSRVVVGQLDLPTEDEKIHNRPEDDFFLEPIVDLFAGPWSERWSEKTTDFVLISDAASWEETANRIAVHKEALFGLRKVEDSLSSFSLGSVNLATMRRTAEPLQKRLMPALREFYLVPLVHALREREGDDAVNMIVATIEAELRGESKFVPQETLAAAFGVLDVAEQERVISLGRNSIVAIYGALEYGVDVAPHLAVGGHTRFGAQRVTHRHHGIDFDAETGYVSAVPQFLHYAQLVPQFVGKGAVDEWYFTRKFSSCLERNVFFVCEQRSQIPTDGASAERKNP